MFLLKGDYVLGVWHSETEGLDFLASVVKRGNKWLGEFRWRYIVDNNIFENSKDIKKFKRFETDDRPGIEQELKEDISELVFSGLGFKDFKNKQYLEIKGDAEKCLFMMGQQKWCHKRTGKKVR